MSGLEHMQPVAREVVIEFLQKTLPFCNLAPSEITELGTSCAVGFYPKGATVCIQDFTEVRHLYVIQRGGVRIYVTSEDSVETLVDYRGEGASFGALSLMKGGKAHLNVQTVEDTFCFLLNKHAFMNVIRNNPQFSQHFSRIMSSDLTGSAYSELRCKHLGARAENAFHLFTCQIGDVVSKPPEIIPASESVSKAAERMARLEIGSLLVSDESEKIVGILTDKDLRKKVVAKRMDYDAHVGTIMAAPLLTVSAHAPCFEAILQMMRSQVHHLAVERHNEIVGVITAHDILVFQGNAPFYLLQEIVSQKKMEGLYGLSQKVPSVIRTLIEEGAKAHNITRMISVLHDHIIQRLLTLLQEKMGPPPARFFWMVMGSEGRKEQTFRADQDNALVYEDPGEGWDNIKQAKLYFRHFGNSAVEHLAACGYPLCTHHMMASNARWRKPYPAWTGYFEQWMLTADPDEALYPKFFFDFRPLYGDQALAQKLKDQVTKSAAESKSFLNRLAKDCLAILPPLSFFRNFIVEKDGEHKNRLDLKLRGLVPLVDFARVMALKHGIQETNTLERLTLLEQGGQITRDLHIELTEAYEFLMQLRLVHQLKMMEAGEEPHNHLDPAQLSELEKKTLKEAFGVISRMQTYVGKIW